VSAIKKRFKNIINLKSKLLAIASLLILGYDLLNKDNRLLMGLGVCIFLAIIITSIIHKLNWLEFELTFFLLSYVLLELIFIKEYQFNIAFLIIIVLVVVLIMYIISFHNRNITNGTL